MRIRSAALGLLASACWLWPSASEAAFEVPKEATQWKRQFVGTVRQVWGLQAPAWLAAQVGQESGWRDGLTSSAGAKGMCQFIPATAAGIERQYDGLAALGRYSPRWCFFAQSMHMRDLFRKYQEGRTDCNAMRFAGSAYNGGPTMLARETALCLTHKGCDAFTWEGVAAHNARAGWAYRENRNYVQRITDREPAYGLTGWGRTYCKAR